MDPKTPLRDLTGQTLNRLHESGASKFGLTSSTKRSSGISSSGTMAKGDVRIEKLVIRLSHLERERADLQKLVKSSEERASQATRQNQELRQRLTASYKELGDLQQENEKLLEQPQLPSKEQEGTFYQELAQQKLQLDSLKKQLKEESNKVLLLKSDLKSVQNNKEDTDQRLKDTIQEKASIQKQLSQLLAQQSRNFEVQAEKEKLVEELRQQLSQAQAQVSTFTTKVTAEQNKNTKLSAMVIQMKQELDAMKKQFKDIGETKQAIDAVQVAREELEKKVVVLRETGATNNKLIHKLESQLEQTLKLKEAALKELSQAQAEIGMFKDQASSVGSNQVELEATIKKLQEEKRILGMANMNKSREIADLKKEYSILQEEKVKCLENIEESTSAQKHKLIRLIQSDRWSSTMKSSDPDFLKSKFRVFAQTIVALLAPAGEATAEALGGNPHAWYAAPPPTPAVTAKVAAETAVRAGGASGTGGGGGFTPQAPVPLPKPSQEARMDLNREEKNAAADDCDALPTISEALDEDDPDASGVVPTGSKKRRRSLRISSRASLGLYTPQKPGTGSIVPTVAARDPAPTPQTTTLSKKRYKVEGADAMETPSNPVAKIKAEEAETHPTPASVIRRATPARPRGRPPKRPNLPLAGAGLAAENEEVAAVENMGMAGGASAAGDPQDPHWVPPTPAVTGGRRQSSRIKANDILPVEPSLWALNPGTEGGGGEGRADGKAPALSPPHCIEAMLRASCVTARHFPSAAASLVQPPAQLDVGSVTKYFNSVFPVGSKGCHPLAVTPVVFAAALTQMPQPLEALPAALIALLRSLAAAEGLVVAEAAREQQRRPPGAAARGGNRVHFPAYDFSAVAMPLDTRPGTADHALEVGGALAAVAGAQDALAAAVAGGDAAAQRALYDLHRALAALARLPLSALEAAAAALRASSPASLPLAAVGAASFRRCAGFYAAEARAVLDSSEGPAVQTPTRLAAANLISTTVRYHLRRLLNPPPPHLTTASAAWAPPPFPPGTRSEVWRAVRPVATAGVSHVYGAAADGCLSSLAAAALRGVRALALAQAQAAAVAAQGPAMFCEMEKVEDIIRLHICRIFGCHAARFLSSLLGWPGVGQAIERAGGWGPVERAASLLASVVTSEDAHLLILSDIGSMKRWLQDLEDQSPEIEKKSIRFLKLILTNGCKLEKEQRDEVKAVLQGASKKQLFPSLESAVY